MDNPLFGRIMTVFAAVEERKGGAELRTRLLEGLSGRVIEVGVGSGPSLSRYPREVEHITAVEPDPYLRGKATQAAAEVDGIDIDVVDGLVESLPAPEDSYDAAVVSLLLCSVPDPQGALAEIARVLKPGGQLRFFEHVASHAPGLARMQTALDSTFWPHAFGGCRLTRDTRANIEAAGLRIDQLSRFSFRPSVLGLPVSPRILGRASLPAG